MNKGLKWLIITIIGGCVIVLAIVGFYIFQIYNEVSISNSPDVQAILTSSEFQSAINKHVNMYYPYNPQYGPVKITKIYSPDKVYVKFTVNWNKYGQKYANMEGTWIKRNGKWIPDNFGVKSDSSSWFDVFIPTGSSKQGLNPFS